MILPEVGHCHATFDAIGATTLALIGVLLVWQQVLVLFLMRLLPL